MRSGVPGLTMSNAQVSIIGILELLHKSNNKLGEIPLLTLIGEADRFKNFSCSVKGILLDFSRTHLNKEALDLLLSLAKASGVEEHRASLFNAEAVNTTENRPAMHMALRSRELAKRLPAKEAGSMEKSMDQMLQFAGQFHAGRLPSDSKQNIRDIVHVGIGGSLLGTKLLCDVFQSQTNRSSDSQVPRVHFLGSVDAHIREQLLRSLNPHETAVVLVSKSFSTKDTLLHGASLQKWMESSLGTEGTRARVFAVTNRVDQARAFGVTEQQILFMPLWVGGRYSLWSPVSLAAAAIAGPDAFLELLQGGAEMDQHFLTAKSEENLPVLMGLLGVWHRNICGYASWGVIPYDQRLRILPAYLQQLIMESNGKSVTTNGTPTSLATAPMVFGECGTDAQHSLFQAMHQGTDKSPLNLIGIIRPDHDDNTAHSELLANLLAQARALAVGRSAEETGLMMEAEGNSVEEGLLSHRTFEGNRPTELLLLDDLSPVNLGKLLALYEHKVFVESVIWGINAFDQWGVELGKSLTPEIRCALAGDGPSSPDLESLMVYIRDRM